MSNERFFVDQRVGIIAVRDRTKTDPDYQGLHRDTEGVVWSASGELRDGPQCPTCKRSHGKEWFLPDAVIEEASRRCKELNQHHTESVAARPQE